MNELQAVVGLCSDCVHCWIREFVNAESEDCFMFRCLLSTEPIEEYTSACSHHTTHKCKTLFLNDEFF